MISSAPRRTPLADGFAPRSPGIPPNLRAFARRLEEIGEGRLLFLPTVPPEAISWHQSAVNVFLPLVGRQDRLEEIWESLLHLSQPEAAARLDPFALAVDQAGFAEDLIVLRAG